MEYLDILDKNGQPTGQRQTREEVHRTGAWHKAVHVWILNSGGELLIQKRASTKDTHPNMWDVSCAGHIRAGDDAYATAVRELQEELGLVVQPAELEYLFTSVMQKVLDQGRYIHNELGEVFLLRRDLDVAQIQCQQSEVANVQFVPFLELEELIHEGGRDFVPRNEYDELFTYLHHHVEPALAEPPSVPNQNRSKSRHVPH